MLIFAKVALGLGAAVAVAGVYVFREGVIRVDVDEHRASGSHVHLLVPAALVGAGLHVVPQAQLQCGSKDLQPYLPLLREVSKELEKYPEVEFVDVSSERDHVRVAMVAGKLRIDAVSEDGDVVHVSVPAQVLSDVADELERRAPGV